MTFYQYGYACFVSKTSICMYGRFDSIAIEANNTEYWTSIKVRQISAFLFSIPQNDVIFYL